MKRLLLSIFTTLLISSTLVTASAKSILDNKIDKQSFVKSQNTELTIQEAYKVPIYRLYNYNNLEHLYTSDRNEALTLSQAELIWRDEGIAWVSSSEGTPVYRLYNPSTGYHLFTTDENEKNVLTSQQGWSADNNGQPLFYSGGSIPVYRLYDPNAHKHLLTMDENEYNILGSNGWNPEGVKLYAIEGSQSLPEKTESSNSGDFKYIESPGALRIYEYAGGYKTGDTYTLPSFHDGKDIVEMYPHVYCDLLHFKTVNVPDSYFSLGLYFMYKNETLETINISGSVQKIVAFICSDCPNLKTVKIGVGTKRIFDNAFSNCPNLESVYIPSTVTMIDPTSFEGENNVTIYGQAGSAAQEFAAQKGFKFVESPDLPHSGF